jgi:hypothetical protein
VNPQASRSLRLLFSAPNERDSQRPSRNGNPSDHRRSCRNYLFPTLAR